MTNRSGIEGQNILVTGGSGGISVAIVRRLHKEGAKPSMQWGRDEAGTRSLLKETEGGTLRRGGGRSWMDSCCRKRRWNS